MIRSTSDAQARQERFNRLLPKVLANNLRSADWYKPCPTCGTPVCCDQQGSCFDCGVDDHLDYVATHRRNA